MIELTREDAAALYDAYERALKAISEAEPVILSLPKTPERDQYFRAHTGVICDILSQLRAPLVLQYRDLDTDRPEGPPDVELTDAERRTVATLSEAQVALIDSALLADCAVSWRKVALVVGTALNKLPLELRDVPYGFLVQRVQVLADSDRLESKGNLAYMRFSEVRLPA
jgi:hypothetical protein